MGYIFFRQTLAAGTARRIAGKALIGTSASARADQKKIHDAHERKIDDFSMRRKEGDMSKQPDAKTKPGPGGPAPAFALPVDGGGSVSLQSFKGRKLVLYFYPKDDTSGCTKEAIDFNRLKAEFDKAGAAILGVSPDAMASHAKFKVKHGLDIALASDETKAMLEAYGVWVKKSMYGRKYMGVERPTLLIDRAGVIAKVWNKVKVPGHAEAVLAAAKELA